MTGSHATAWTVRVIAERTENALLIITLIWMRFHDGDTGSSTCFEI